ncbi:MAG: PQQ-binding-like beta-propeller repeat protein [Verrucomicrobiae bacterium]|nr:PQQ-binding-like beta-propeller repeat protein [Verrucomicrobiae bacterium]
MKRLTFAAMLFAAISSAGSLFAQDGDVNQGNWISWRGPLQTGVSLEHYKDFEFNPEPIWSDAISGRGNPVVFKGRIYSWGYRGKGPTLMEVLQARDEKTGDVIWERETQDFMSDTVYSRYTIGAPAIDPETGNILMATTYGLVTCYTPDGDIVWQHSMVERFGRLTFPNGRAGSPVIDGNIVIIRGVTSYWGADGPARDRFFGFDKNTGELLWSSTPGVGPPYLKDSSMSTPFLSTIDGKRVFYAGTGCGNIVCVNVNDGTPIWRWQVSKGGINASPVLFGNELICIHGAENMDTTETGRLFAINIPTDLDNIQGEVEEGQGGAPKLASDIEQWRYTFEQFTSSPLLEGDKVFQMDKTGLLICMDAKTGEKQWELKLANEQLHASPAYADGKLFVPTMPGDFYVLDVSGDQPKQLHKVKLEGNLIGSPTICNGRVYVHSTEKLYCFEIKNSGITWDKTPETVRPEAGDASKLLPVPSDVLLKAGDKLSINLRSLDANGLQTGSIDSADWAKFIPPTAKVKAEMDASFDGNTISAAQDAAESAGAWKATHENLGGILRGRVISNLPYLQDFESFELENGFAFPPLAWIGARLKWEVREQDGNKVLAKTLDSVLFQRALSFIGDPDLSNYTLQADVMTDGNRRVKSVVGVINQRYIISLVGNANTIEVSSNHEHFNVTAPFPVSANQWYTLKTRVDVAEDGSGVVRAKAWKKGEPEPEAWSIEAPHQHAHTKGAPGLFGFSPQAQKSVFIDNVSVTAN